MKTIQIFNLNENGITRLKLPKFAKFICFNGFFSCLFEVNTSHSFNKTKKLQIFLTGDKIPTNSSYLASYNTFHLYELR